ncbi:NDMA-dependent alcohol dehydrogenase [Gordonia sp. HNM0687]|uniref:alcohol dehydrogenase n=1 Tax=Gordonia mangrovi TaxID=2665643 RepID=A0A6L7GNJ2_9ACTN|nr:NDMA-dependent alcohol dehydrogenase [Gordonia mangrovi]MXP21436.1 NDMA-dependent alcohol dehydrogenase [Gordonia mangrovi]UVF80183.1 NDMA-dependent alcohol dehydrogenase [Gordonia mangrovi]
MKTKSAVVYEVGQPVEVVELDLKGPAEGEVLIRWVASGICHTDVHPGQGDLEVRTPMVLGHEGAGVVEEVGPAVTRVRPGDHVVCTSLPSCGTCHYCATGQQAICDMGETILQGFLPGDRYVFTGPRGDYGAMCMLGTFSQYSTVHHTSVIKIDPSIPLETAALMGCGVPTGWGSAVNAADVVPGETVIVYGIGGIGVNAVQGARFAGAKHIIAVDPLENKMKAALDFGATHAVSTHEEAHQIARDLTNGVGADKAIVTIGIVEESDVSDAFTAIAKGGTVVVTGLNQFAKLNVHVSGTELALFKKTIRGTLWGDCNPTTDINRLLGLYQNHDLKLDELVTTTYRLDDVNNGIEDMLNGTNLRGLIVHE